MPPTPMMRASPGLSTANIIPTTSATKSAPSRNMTRVMRAVRPESLMKRLAAMGSVSAPSAGDEAVVGQELPHLVDGGVTRRQDQVRLVERVVGVVGAVLAHAGQQRLQGAAEPLLVAGLDGRLDRPVELVEGRHRVVG